MRPEGAERLVLRTLLYLQGDSGEYVEDASLADAAKMLVGDVRDWLETLEGKGFVERARQVDGFSAYVTGKGKQALRMTEPIPSSSSAGVGDSSGSPNLSTPSGAAQPTTDMDASAATKTTGPIRLFYSYSHKDEKLREKLEEHLSLLQRQGIIAGWHDRKIGAGEEWKGAIDTNLEEAQVILLLVSSSFLASDYCWDVETKRAMERHENGKARVIPVILRPCDWHKAPFGKLQALPKEGKAVTSWKNRDEAWTDVSKGIRGAVERMTAGRLASEGSKSTGTSDLTERPIPKPTIGIRRAVEQVTAGRREKRESESIGNSALSKQPITKVTIKVFNFSNEGRNAKKGNLGGRFPGFILDALLKRKMKAAAENKTWDDMRVVPVRGPVAPVHDRAYANLCPFIAIFGYIDDIYPRHEGQADYSAHIRVVAGLDESYIKEGRVQLEPLGVEEATFSDSTDSMRSAALSVEAKIVELIEHNIDTILLKHSADQNMYRKLLEDSRD